MQLNMMHGLPRFLISVVGITLLLMLATTSYRREVHYQQEYMLPCIMRIFEVPHKQTSYGFPMFWLTTVEGIRMVGCGSVIGDFSTHSIIWQGFLVDFVFYALCCSLVLYLMKRALS